MIAAVDATVQTAVTCDLCLKKIGPRPVCGLNGYRVCQPCYARVWWIKRLIEMIGEPVPPEMKAILDLIPANPREAVRP
jgi:hypothetical protein